MSTRSHRLAGVMMFVVLAIAGLTYVKWNPYYHKAFIAAAHHSIGASIITGQAAAAPAPSWHAALQYAWVYGKAIWQALILGLLLGSGIQTLLPTQWVRQAFGKVGFGSVAKASVLAIPSMMCTCCAAPVVVGLRKSEASPGAAIAYWLGNTVLNPAVLVFMFFVLGWHWTLLRLAIGLPMVLGIGWLVNRISPTDATVDTTEILPSEAVPEDQPSIWVRWMKNFWKLAIGLVPEYLLFVLLLGAVRAWLFPVIPHGASGGLMLIIGMAVAGTLFVIPTAGEIPVVQTLLSLGIGAGPAGALLMTLAPVSLPSLMMVSKVFPARTLAIVSAVVIGVGIVSGLVAMGLGF